VKVRARRVPPARLGAKLAGNVRSPAEIVLHVGVIEGEWVHRAIGGNPPSPPPPPVDAGLEALFAWLDAVRKASYAVLRPLVERDLDTLRVVPGKEGKTTVRRILAELLEHQAHHRGQLGLLAKLLATAS
jgi:uncharacterized damage-inducible protein DinB